MTYTTNGTSNNSFQPQVLPELDLDLEQSTNDQLPAGYAKVSAGIPKELNYRLKALARRKGKTALVFIGEILMKYAAELDRIEAHEEVAKLRERFGTNWIQILKQADETSI